MKNLIGPQNILSVARPGNVPNGGYGDYVNLGDGTGVKIFRYTMSWDKDVDTSVAQDEYQVQLECRKIFGDLVPDVHGVVVVESHVEFYGREPGPAYFAGMIMEHIEGETLSEHLEKAIPSSDELYALTQVYMNCLLWQFREKGVEKNDHHDNNVMITKEGRIVVIDFGCGVDKFNLDVFTNHEFLLDEKAKYA